jgi:hypothetical protein
LFGAEPVKLKPEYAKWLLDDPRVNFAISTRSEKVGLDHFGIQVDEESELTEVRNRLKKAEMKTFDEGETTCCYAEADKTWVVDPVGVAWESYRTMADVETFGTDRKKEKAAGETNACCAPKSEKVVAPATNAADKKSGGCGG